MSISDDQSDSPGPVCRVCGAAEGKAAYHGLCAECYREREYGWAAPICHTCGAEIATAAVYCRSCRTPHHEHCWRAAGACSAYGCGENRFKRDTSRGTFLGPLIVLAVFGVVALLLLAGMMVSSKPKKPKPWDFDDELVEPEDDWDQYGRRSRWKQPPPPDWETPVEIEPDWPLEPELAVPEYMIEEPKDK